MSKTYFIEFWNDEHMRYERVNNGTTLECAELQMTKSYNSHIARRLVSVETTVLYKMKANSTKKLNVQTSQVQIENK